jgi:cobaltochelatase CobS
MMFEKLLRAANTRLPNGYAPGIFLSGEASSGKTTGSKMVAEALKLKWYFNGAISMPHEMLGFIDANGKYHTTPFRQAYEFGGVYTFDEVDRSDPNALLAVNPHLANGVATFPDKQIKRHPDCIIICTANTWGLAGSSDYSGATKLDAAFLSRFPVRIGWDIDPVLEEKIVDHAEWLARVRTVRGRARAVGLKVMIDTRIAQAGAALIASGFTMDEAAEMTYLANMKPEQRKQVEG